MKTGKTSEFVRSSDTSFQGKLPKKTQIVVHLLEPEETFSIREDNNAACCLYQKISPMTLSPFDVACVRKVNDLTSSIFFEKYATLTLHSESQVPRAFLNSFSASRKKDKQCPYIIEKNGKRIDARPLGCRLYPVITAIDNKGMLYFARVDEDGLKRGRKVKKFTLESWIKQVGAKKWLTESERYETLLRDLVNQNNNTFSEHEKMTVASMLYSPDAFASEDLFGSYLKKPELALEAMEFGYTRAQKFIDERLGIMSRR